MLDNKVMNTTLDEIVKLRDELSQCANKVDQNHVNYKSLLNLEHYLKLRRKDRTQLQEKLFLLSLSSLGRSYAHVGGSVDRLFEQLNSSINCDGRSVENITTVSHIGIEEAIKLASRNSTRLFGGTPSSKLSQQTTAIMITLPSNAADNEGALIIGLVNAGVNAFRINTAHDDITVWNAMADVIKSINSTREDDKKIKIFVDLAGPKIRTGKIRKQKIAVEIGSNKTAQEVLIFSDKKMMTTPQTKDSVTLKKELAHITVERDFYKKLKNESVIHVIDTNGKKALIHITAIDENCIKGLIDKKVYLDENSKLYKKKRETSILNIQMQVEPIRLFKGDMLDISEDDVLGKAATYNEPALISCSFKGISDYLKLGEKIFIDDGKICLEVVSKHEHFIRCKVILAKANGTLLQEEKGINFPDTHIKTAALTEIDRINALSVMHFTDGFSLSFCQDAQDVKDLENLLLENGGEDIAIIAKIETQKAVVNMPEILQELLNWQKSGVMIARGDLAIEVGFQNLAHIQESLLDICDAAHIPVIWATQVLESQMKTNLPSRAEITDAAMAGRAECVMLNKGAFATDTIGVLIHILDTMHIMFKKNRQLLSKQMLW